jgi:peptidyl-prolyl cis-trans isomerase C
MTRARFVVTRSRAAAGAPPVPEKSAGAGSGCGCGGGRARLGEDLPPVRVGAVEIGPEAIAREMQNHPGGDPEQAWREAARALAVRELLLAEARRLGLDLAPASIDDDQAETAEESLLGALLERALAPAAPTDEECRRVYETQQARLVTPTLFEASHILIEPAGDDEAAWAAAEAEAGALIELVGDDPGVFAEAAAARSACPTASQGGSLGQVRRGELAPPVQAALEALAEGAVAPEPVRSRFGWHVVRLARRIEGGPLPFEAVRERIRDMLEARAWALDAARYVAELAAAAEIEGVELAAPDAGFSACAEGRGC